MVLDDDTDWEEVRELVTESYCVLAPKKLVAGRRSRPFWNDTVPVARRSA
jgi:hypothetical protein